MTGYFLNTFLKIFFIFTPFFIFSTFVSMTQEYDSCLKKKLAVKVILAALAITILIYLAGDYIFYLFGINLDSFRIGTGIMLLLTAIQLVNGRDRERTDTDKNPHDIVVVPMATPVLVGPATMGTILVMSSETASRVYKLIDVSAIIAALFLIGFLLYISGTLEKLISKQGVKVMSKISGLILSAIASQMIMTGVSNFLK